MIIRTMKKSDLAGLMALLAKVVDYHRRIDSYYKPFSKFKNLKAEAESWLKDKDLLVLAAEDGGELIGYFRGSAESAPDYVDRDKIGIVYDVFILEPYRRQGIAKMFFAQARKWFLKKRVKNIELNVDARNSAAIKFWKELGFFDYKLRMRLDL